MVRDDGDRPQPTVPFNRFGAAQAGRRVVGPYGIKASVCVQPAFCQTRHPGIDNRHERSNGNRPQHPSVGADDSVRPRHRCIQPWLNGNRLQHPLRRAGLTPRALAPPTAHSSQGVAGAAPPNPPPTPPNPGWLIKHLHTIRRGRRPRRPANPATITAPPPPSHQGKMCHVFRP